MIRSHIRRNRRLAARVASGDMAALEMLFDDLAPGVHDVVSWIVEDRDVGRQVTADVFADVWRTAGCRLAGDPVGWVMTIAVRRAETVRDTAGPGIGTRRVARPGRRPSVALALYTALTYRQIAELLGVTAAVAAVQIRAGLADLARIPVAVVGDA